MVDHNLCQTGTVNKYDFGIDERGIVGCFFREGGCGYEYAFSGALALQRAGELLNLRPANGAIPPLCLDVDDVQAEFVLLDYAVDAAVSCSALLDPPLGGNLRSPF
jgi:hypothetical protein